MTSPLRLVGLTAAPTNIHATEHQMANMAAIMVDTVTEAVAPLRPEDQIRTVAIIAKALIDALATA